LLHWLWAGPNIPVVRVNANVVNNLVVPIVLNVPVPAADLGFRCHFNQMLRIHPPTWFFVRMLVLAMKRLGCAIAVKVLVAKPVNV
jgi:hypothetical protein